MSQKIVVYSDVPRPKKMSTYKGACAKNLWNDESVNILLNEYKKLKEAYSIRRSSNMPKKGWEAIKRKLHEAGFKEIRHQHVVKKFATLKLHYKELKEGLPVKQRVYGFVDLLSDILDDDPYIAFAKPTKRMKEKRLTENVQKNKDRNYITLEFTDLESRKITEIIQTTEDENFEGGQYVDATILLGDQVEMNPVDGVKLGTKKKKPLKYKKKEPPHVDVDRPGMPSWICYLEQLLRKEEKQRASHLWRLHDDICQAQKVKVDMLERLVTNITSSKLQQGGLTQLVIPENKLVVDSKNPPRNIIIVDEEGSIYLKPTKLLKRKGESIEYIVPHKMLKSRREVEILATDSVEPSQLKLELLGEGDEIIIENCDDSQIYKVEHVSEEDLEDSNVISHVEIVEEQVEEDILVDHDMDNIEFIETVDNDPDQ